MLAQPSWVAALRAARRDGALPTGVSLTGPLVEPGLLTTPAWLPIIDDGIAGELELVLVVAEAVATEGREGLSAEESVVLDVTLPGWREPSVRRWLGVTRDG